MRSERITTCFAEIVAAIDLIKIWVDEAGGVEAAIHQNLLVRSAVERQLSIISEAAIRLNKLDPNAEAALAPEIDWAGIRGIENVLRHKYDDIDVRIIIDVLHNHLGDLQTAAEMALCKIDADKPY